VQIPRYDTSNKWFKGNTHIHSKMSDGGKNFSEIAELYNTKGYDFLFRTDHWVASDVKADKTEYPLLWIDGIELDGTDRAGVYYHVVCLGKAPTMTRETGFENGMNLAKASGAIMILAHPEWSGNRTEDALRWDFHGVEVYNHVCRWLNGKSSGSAHFSAMLDKSKDALAFASDDAHLNVAEPVFDGGWIIVNAPSLDGENILQAIRLGNFYSSCGPEIHSISYEGKKVRVKTSPVRFIRLVGRNGSGLRNGSFSDLVEEAVFDIPEEWPYAYIELEDEYGRKAWTNTLA